MAFFANKLDCSHYQVNTLTLVFQTVLAPTNHAQTLEHLNIFKELESAKRGTLLYKQVVILDLAGLGMKHASSDFTGPMRAVVDIDQVCTAFVPLSGLFSERLILVAATHRNSIV